MSALPRQESSEFRSGATLKGWLLAFPCGRFLAAQFNSNLEPFVTLGSEQTRPHKQRSIVPLVAPQTMACQTSFVWK